MTIKKNNASSIIIVITFVSISYAIIRYNIIGDVAWKDLPFFVLNKGIALSSLVLLTINFSLGPLQHMGIKIPDNWLQSRRSMGIAGFLFALIHVFMSLSILTPKYYSVFFVEEGTLSLRGGLSLLGGILSFIFLWIYNISFKPVLKQDEKIIKIITSRKYLVYGMLLTGIHLFFMGYTGWTTVDKWQGGLPPISLISFVTFFVGFIINLLGRK